MKMIGKYEKSYETIIKEKGETKDFSLIKSEVNVTDIIKAENITQMIAKASTMVPAIHKKMMIDSEGVPAEFKEKWLSTIDEAHHSMEIAPQRRTLTEKTLAVLQSNRHPTAGAKFHQANLEQSVYAGQLIDLQFNYEESKIRMEEKFYKYQKKKEQLEASKERGEDTFLKEKKLQREQIALVKLAMELAGTQNRMQNMREEIAEWSDLKKELYDQAMADGEVWSPDAIDGSAGLQEIPLVLRHFQNFLIQLQHGEGSDISSTLNIQGLCLTAFQNGLKKNKLGLYMKTLANEQIALLWKHLYGVDVHIERTVDFMIVSGTSFQQAFPLTLEVWQKVNSLNSTV